MISKSQLCPIYEKEVETVCHVLWSCGAASNMWTEFSGPIQNCSCTEEEFGALWKRISKTVEELEVVAITMRSL